MWDAQPQDEAGNVIEGPAEAIDTRNSLIRSEDTVLTTVIGLDDVVVIATADAVLVVAQREAERSRTSSSSSRPRTAARRWNTAASTGRGASTRALTTGALSGQAHLREPRRAALAAEALPPLRALGGGARRRRGHRRRGSELYHENESAYVPIGAVHRLANPGKIPLELIEVQVGSYLGEDDILRLEDVYRRHAEA